MNAISANDLKVKGIKALEEELTSQSEVAVRVRGQLKYVVMTHEHYQYMRECELEAALSESRADIEAGRYEAVSPGEHLKKIKSGPQTNDHSSSRTTSHTSK